LCNGSAGLKSLFHVEMNLRNLKIAARMLYENKCMQLHNKNVKMFDFTRVQNFFL